MKKGWFSIGKLKGEKKIKTPKEKDKSKDGKFIKFTRSVN